MSHNNRWVDISGQAGYSNKVFGANSFYSPLYPEQFEKTKTLFSSVRLEKNIHQFKMVPSIYWRRHQDHFRLERNNPAFYTNNHLTNVFGADFNLSYETKIGITAIGIEFRKEAIMSNSLGDPMNDAIAVPGEKGFYFTREKSRNDISLFLQHHVDFHQFNFDIGLISYYKSTYQWKTFPGINMSYKLNDKLRAFTGFNYSFRIPTFTELYYSSPTNHGNINLNPETSATLDVGAKYFNNIYFSQFSLFYRTGKDLIDWALDTSGIWISRNVNDINAYGLEYELKIYFHRTRQYIPFLQSLKANYTYLHLDKSSGSYTSFYILDFLRHKFILQSYFILSEKIGFSFVYNYQNRAGTYTDFQTGQETKYKPFKTVDVNIFWSNNRFKCYFFVNNLFDVEYADLANIPMPGRWIKLGLKYNLPL